MGQLGAAKTGQVEIDPTAAAMARHDVSGWHDTELSEFWQSAQAVSVRDVGSSDFEGCRPLRGPSRLTSCCSSRSLVTKASPRTATAPTEWDFARTPPEDLKNPTLHRTAQGNVRERAMCRAMAGERRELVLVGPDAPPPRLDAVDFAIRQVRSTPRWLERRAVKTRERRQVAHGIWAFERREALINNQFEYLTKRQLLRVLETLPVSVARMVRETGKQLEVPKDPEALSKAQLVEHMCALDALFAAYDAVLEERRKADLLETDADSSEAGLEDQSDDETSRATTPAAAPLRFRTKALGQGTSVVTPRQSRLLQRVYFAS